MKNADDKLGIALLGLGTYATEQLATALLETKHCYLAGIATGTPAKAVQWKKQYGLDDKNIYDYDDFDSIKDNPDIDIVYIVVPNALHAEFAIRSARAGKHVICEKPMATTVEDCDRMIGACKQAGVSLSIGYRLHFEPYNQEMMRLGKTQHYGPIQKITASFGLNGTEGWRLNKALAGGGALMDLGIYCLQASNYITGMRPIAVRAEGEDNTMPGKFADIEAAVDFQLEYPGGYTADCACSYVKGMSVLRAQASNGFFELEPAFDYTGISGKASYGEMHFDQINQQAAQMDAIALAIKQNKPSPVPGEMGRDDVNWLTAIYTAMKSKTRVLTV